MALTPALPAPRQFTSDLTVEQAVEHGHQETLERRRRGESGGDGAAICRPGRWKLYLKAGEELVAEEPGHFDGLVVADGALHAHEHGVVHPE